MSRLMRFSAMCLIVGGVLNISGVALAGGPVMGVPEIDPASAASALAVLAGGGLMLAERFGFRRR